MKQRIVDSFAIKLSFATLVAVPIAFIALIANDGGCTPAQVKADLRFAQCVVDEGLVISTNRDPVLAAAEIVAACGGTIADVIKELEAAKARGVVFRPGSRGTKAIHASAK